jgi:rhodanese-related sulfurtransferase
MHFRTFTAFALALGLAFSSAIAHAAPEPSDPKKQTSWHLYLTAQEAADIKAKRGNEILFVDVREPIEIMFTGFTDVVDVNIPFLLVNPSKWNPKKPVFAMEPNPDFADSIERALAERGLDKSAPIILMCRSGGTRGAPSAKALEGRGFEAVYVVVDGFEGSVDKKNSKGPWRVVNGWKNAGLPWSYDLNPDKLYKRPAD